MLWTAFPVAFAAIMSTLFVPLAWRVRDRAARGGVRVPAGGLGLAARRAAGAVFAASSVITPFFLGTAAGAIAGGRVAVGDGPVDLIGLLAEPDVDAGGGLAVSACAYLAAVFLVADACLGA